MYGYIYETTNLINGKKYIGKRVKPKFDGNYKGSGKVLKHAIEKYGWDNFECKIIEECDSKEQLEEREKYWIDHYDAVENIDYYNLVKGGTGGDTFSCMSEEGRALRVERLKEVSSKANKGKVYIHKGDTTTWIKPENLESYVNDGWQLGRSKKFQDALTKSHIGIKQTDEWVQNRVNAILNKTDSEKLLSHKIRSSAQKIAQSKLSDEFKSARGRAARNAKKLLFPNSKQLWVNKDGINKFIYEPELSKYIELGFVLGRVDSVATKQKRVASAKAVKRDSGYKFVYKDSITKKIRKDELESYLNDGWLQGNLNLRNISHKKEA